MKETKEGILLRIFIGEDDRYKGKPLYEQIVTKARELGLAGATVFRGILGYGANSRLHSAKLLRLSEDMPMVIELVDSEENIKKLLPFLDESVKQGFVSMEKVKVIRYK
ncbi:MAG: DUF190 domain-containing protein [Candidatus Hydrogenedentota bacterium]|nr:MAG: DUF190 domain-containing protein [Candidatus Hydrogenedentota bacterium]